MSDRGVRLYHLAGFLRISDAGLSLRLSGRYPLEDWHKDRICQYLGFNDKAWLFAEARIPAAAARREDAMLRPLLETR